MGPAGIRHYTIFESQWSMSNVLLPVVNKQLQFAIIRDGETAEQHLLFVVWVLCLRNSSANGTITQNIVLLE